jgi:pterin-4a-carbinolamine dehydratase
MLTLQEIEAHMVKLKDWDLDLNTLTKTTSFEDSTSVSAFVSKIIELSEDLQHYPEIIINGKIIKLNLITKPENVLTKSDFDLAEAIDKLM